MGLLPKRIGNAFFAIIAINYFIMWAEAEMLLKPTLPNSARRPLAEGSPFSIR